jgi:hypothetical protein
MQIFASDYFSTYLKRDGRFSRLQGQLLDHVSDLLQEMNPENNLKPITLTERPRADFGNFSKNIENIDKKIIFCRRI